jgi:hypothetical protein
VIAFRRVEGDRALVVVVPRLLFPLLDAGRSLAQAFAET